MAGRVASKIPGKRNPFFSNLMGGIAFTVGAKAGTTITVTVQGQNYNGGNVAAKSILRAYLSDNADGSNYIVTAPSGTVVKGAAGIAVQDVSAAKKMFLFILDATGKVDVAITDAGPRNMYLVVETEDGNLVVSPVLAF